MRAMLPGILLAVGASTLLGCGAPSDEVQGSGASGAAGAAGAVGAAGAAGAAGATGAAGMSGAGVCIPTERCDPDGVVRDACEPVWARFERCEGGRCVGVGDWCPGEVAPPCEVGLPCVEGSLCPIRKVQPCGADGSVLCDSQVSIVCEGGAYREWEGGPAEGESGKVCVARGQGACPAIDPQDSCGGLVGKLVFWDCAGAWVSDPPVQLASDGAEYCCYEADSQVYLGRPLRLEGRVRAAPLAPGAWG